MISSLPVYLLPKTLPNTDEVRMNREQNNSDREPETNSLRLRYHTFYPAFSSLVAVPYCICRLKVLLTNPIFIFVSLWVLMYESLVYALATYAVKLVVELLGLEESTAGFLLGSYDLCLSMSGVLLY